VLSGPFCSACGQRALPPEPTAKELVTEAYSELAGWDGKVARTMTLLLFRPGELTRRVLEGHRTAYIPAVKLYLMCSLVYFVVAAGAPVPDIGSFEQTMGGAGDMTASQAALARALTRGAGSLSADERAAVETEIASQSPIVRPIARQVFQDFPAFRRHVAEALPRALFVLVPVLALLLWLFHRHRTFPAHLYVAAHFQSFVFLALTLVVAAQYTRSVVAVLAATVVLGVAMLVYAVVAQRRVYGGGWLATGVKAVVIAVLYGSAWSVTSLAVSVWAAL
jgi:hypothetical protein